VIIFVAVQSPSPAGGADNGISSDNKKNEKARGTEHRGQTTVEPQPKLLPDALGK